MSLPTDWSDRRLLDLLNVLCENAKVNRKVQAREDADDIRSDVLRRLTAAGALPEGKPLPVWEEYLRRAFDSALADLHRRHLGVEKRNVAREVSETAMRSSESAAGLEGLLLAEETSPTKRAVRNEEVARLEAEIERLPQEQRAVMKAYLEGKRPSQIAAETDSTPDAVSSLIFRATLAIKGAMNPKA